MGAQSQQAVGPRVPSRSQQPQHAAVCTQQTAPGGQAGTSVPCRHLRLPPPGSPLSPLTSLAAGCSARQMAPICWGARARAFIPSTPAGRARPAVPSVCAVPPDGEAGISPGSASLPAPSPNIYQQGPEEIDGVHSIWALPFTELGTSRQAGWRTPLHTDKHVQTLLPLQVSLHSQSRRPRLRTVRLAEPRRSGRRGHKGMRHPRIVGGWVPAPKSCKQQMQKGAYRDAVTPATPHPLPVTAWGTPPLPGPAVGSSQGGFSMLELSGSMCRRPWGGQGFPGSPAVRRAGGVPEPAGFPALRHW